MIIRTDKESFELDSYQVTILNDGKWEYMSKEEILEALKVEREG